VKESHFILLFLSQSLLTLSHFQPKKAGDTLSSFVSINPTTGKALKTYRFAPVSQLKTVLKQSQQAFSRWKNTSFAERIALLVKVGKHLRQQKEFYARMITLEMGKLHTEAVAEVEKCALTCEYFCDHASDFLQEEQIQTEHQKSYVRFDPLGTILAIMPWNFPFWQVFRFCVPALLAGNVVLLKHSRVVPGCALMLEKLFIDTGFARGVFQNVFTDETGVQQLIPYVQGVTLTGSVEAGKTIASQAGKHLKKCVLELGGSDPFLVLSDADVHLAAQTAVKARFLNCGQSCIAAKRFIIVKDHVKTFTDAVVKALESFIVGNPLEDETILGPLVREEQVKKLDKQVKLAIKQGARLLCGGKRLKREGFFYEPTVLTNVKSTNVLFQEEVFGPVLPIIAAKDDAEAVKLANQSSFGLGASVWTRNLQKAEQIAQELIAGFVTINGMVKSDPRLPFGGVKDSGIGRELSRYGMLEFCNVKTVVVA